MRLLIVIPHYHTQKARGAGEHGSEKASAEQRAAVLRSCLLTLRQTFGAEQAHMQRLGRRCNQAISAALDVVICTTGSRHLLQHIDPDIYRHHPTNAEPRLLGYECHEVLAAEVGRYDYYCFLEDDLLIGDPLFFWKLAWFTSSVGPHVVLHPHRFELCPNGPVRKLYIDSSLNDRTISARFQDRTVNPRLSGQVMGQTVAFERFDNPHAGCFFLTEAQLRRWMAQPYFLDRASDFWGPLESAATLGIMRTFHVYKPALENAAFLEIRHLDRRYLGSRIQFPHGFQLAPS